MYPEQVKLEETHCPLDDCSEYEIICEAEDKLHNIPGKFNVVRCKECGLMRTLPRPTLETMYVYYPQDYLPYVNTVVQKQPHSADASKPSAFKQLLKNIIQFNTTPVPPIKVGKMLEVGCASGSFMHKMNSLGWDVEGIEPDDGAAEQARKLGYSVFTGSLEKAEHEPETFDLIIGWMVVEHLHEPVQSLKKLRDWTKQDGYLAISVPNSGAVFPFFKDQWYSLHIPNHTFHYTPETITQVLLQSGWQVEKIFHQRLLVDWIASFGYWLKQHGVNNKLSNFLSDFANLPWFVNQLLYPVAWILSLFGQTGRMTVWAKKIND